MFLVFIGLAFSGGRATQQFSMPRTLARVRERDMRDRDVSNRYKCDESAMFVLNKQSCIVDTIDSSNRDPGGRRYRERIDKGYDTMIDANVRATHNRCTFQSGLFHTRYNCLITKNNTQPLNRRNYIIIIIK